MTKWATYKWATVGDAVVSVSTLGEMPDDLWNAYLQDLSKPNIRSTLAASLATIGVSSIQRKRIADLMRDRRLKAAVVTDEKLVQGLVTAVGWMGVEVKSFSWAELRAAVKYLGQGPSMEERTVDVVMRLKEECLRAK